MGQGQPYEVVLHSPVKRELNKIPNPLFAKIDVTIRGLGDNPRPVGVKKLEGDIHRIRVGNWRIIYAVLDSEHRVVILRVARRTEKTYRRLH